jgi:protein-disulfide isomerase
MHSPRAIGALALVILAGAALSPLAGCGEQSPPSTPPPAAKPADTPAPAADAAAPTAAAGAEVETRKARILGNLKVEFPQLDELDAVMGDLKASPLPGLDEGVFTLGGQRSQRYLVSKDDKSLYLVSGGPIDVSRSTEDIQKVVAERAKQKADQEAAAKRDLDASIAGLPARGNPNAKITIVEFSDFQCPFCARGAATLDEVVQGHKDDVKVVFKNFPLNFHPWAKPAAIAAHCAGTQKGDAFWTLHDAYFKNQGQITPENVIPKSKEFLAGSGIDMAAWSSCAGDTNSEPYKAASAVVDADMALGERLGVSGTPAFFVNGRVLSGAQPATAFEALIAEAKKGS